MIKTLSCGNLSVAAKAQDRLHLAVAIAGWMLVLIVVAKVKNLCH